MTWIDALSLLSHEDGWSVNALGSIGLMKSHLSIKGVPIDFHPTDELWDELCKQLKSKPDVLLLNLMDYDAAALRMEKVKKISPKTKIVFRIHHEPFRLAYLQPGFIDSLRYADLVISPMTFYNNFLQSLLNCNIVSIPFGAKNFRSSVRPNLKSTPNLVLSITKNENPGKNFEIAKKLTQLSNTKIRFTHFIDISKDQMAQRFETATYFFQPSLSEASGSRVLMEAFKHDVVPIVFQSSLSCAYVAKDCGGIVVPHRISRTYLDRRAIKWENSEVNEILKKIENLVDSWSGNTWLPPYFKEEFEVIALTKTLRYLVEQDPQNDLGTILEKILDNSESRQSREDWSAKHILN